MAASDGRAPDEKEENSDSGSSGFYSGGGLHTRQRRKGAGRKARRHGPADECDGCVSRASRHRKH